jgi:ABC-type multidrug transport system fused ATPase/permease subunit
LSTIRNADKIIVVKDGKKVEEGDHDFLLTNYPEGVYAQLIKDQGLATTTAA